MPKSQKGPEHLLRTCMLEVSRTNRNASPQERSRLRRNIAKTVTGRKRRVLQSLETARVRQCTLMPDPGNNLGANAMQYSLWETVPAIGDSGIGMTGSSTFTTGISSSPQLPANTNPKRQRGPLTPHTTNLTNTPEHNPPPLPASPPRHLSPSHCQRGTCHNACPRDRCLK